MPRVTKDVKKEELDKEKKSKTSSTKKTGTTKTKTTSTKKTSTTKTKTTSSKKISTNKAKNVKTATSIKEKKSTSSIAKMKTSTKSAKLIENNVVAEYYDLPYRYNETIVRILYQTPTILFVYWDISDADRKKMQKEYGDNFFSQTKPVLKLINITKNYSFDIEINDFANSWYIHVPDSNCDYKVELHRKIIPEYPSANASYIYVSSSNKMEFPNDHILIDELPDHLRFRNTKTGTISIKDIATFHLIGIHKIYNIHDFYKRFYSKDIWEEINASKMLNPSSMSSS